MGPLTGGGGGMVTDVSCRILEMPTSPVAMFGIYPCQF